ncbi:MAG: hypothetical protein B6D59_00970 [Campylobacteraceae bacterium 4484_4]|nr:MAG: hypothetical protein B6D59_00970 [Campylobacteraceae bacterium 4484_4]
MKKAILMAATASMLFAGADVQPLVDYDKQDEVKAEKEAAKEPVVIPAPVVAAPVVCKTVAAPKPKKWYVGADLMGARFETDSGTCDGLAVLVGKIGYNFNRYFGVEGRIGYGLNDADHDAGGDVEVKENYGLYLKPMLPVGEKGNLFGLLGYAKAKVESTSGNNPNGLSGTTDESSPSFGIGYEHMLGERWSIVVDAVRILHSVESDFTDGTGSPIHEDDVNLDTYGIGLNYKF